jgi:hypothetical protein
MSITWDLVGSFLSALPFEKIVNPIVLETVEKPLVLDYRSGSAHEERFEKSMERNRRFGDPIYKRNIQRLIERNRQFEK